MLGNTLTEKKTPPTRTYDQTILNVNIIYYFFFFNDLLNELNKLL
jgi:hypothetical protein